MNPRHFSPNGFLTITTVGSSSKNEIKASFRFIPLRVSRRGFSLVELLVVTAIISILSTIVTPVVGSVLNSRNLSRAVDVVSNTSAVARQTAMTQGNPVALVVARKNATSSDDSQAVMMLAAPLTPTGPWTPIGTWTKIPAVIQLDVLSRDNSPSFYSSGSGPLTSDLPNKLNGQNVTSYDYVVFYPDGSVTAPVEGPALTFRRLKKGDSLTDYTLVIQSNSGRIKAIQ